MDKTDHSYPWKAWSCRHREGRETAYHIGEQVCVKQIPIILALKARGAEFPEFLQPAGFKAWNFVGSALVEPRA